MFEYPVEDQEAPGISTIIDRTSALGTFETCRLHRAMSAFESNPEDICSHWVLLSLVESRCGAVALGRTYLLPPLSSGGASIVPPWLRFHIPLIEPDRQISRIRLSDKTSRLRAQRHLQLLNHLSELIGCPISRSFTTYCVCLELRSLSSTGVTRLPRYYEPLRHPRAPGLSLTGFRLVLADHALGLPVFRTLSLCTCCRHYPGAASGRTASLTSPRRISLPR